MYFSFFIVYSYILSCLEEGGKAEVAYVIGDVLYAFARINWTPQLSAVARLLSLRLMANG